MNANTSLWNIVLIALLAILASSSAVSYAQQEPTALRVKSFHSENFDRESRRNLRSLIHLAITQGKVQIWIATNAAYDASLIPGTVEFDEQYQEIVDYNLRLLARLNIDTTVSEFPRSGPYVAINATHREMIRLLRSRDVLGFYGIAGGELLER